MITRSLSAVAEVSETDAASFQNVSSRLFGIAYRVLGDPREAEDVVQDAWIRWQATDRGEIRDPAAFLATMTARLAITVGQSARARRETHVGTWLADELDAAADPSLDAERGEALASAVRLLLQKLSPAERAAYVLREAFDYPYRQIAEILQLEEANTRQLVTRARQHIADGRRTPVSSAEQRRLLEAFIAAAQKGDLATLERLFASDVVSYSDGGGVVRTAARAPVSGSERVAKFIAAFAWHFWTGVALQVVDTNGQASVLISRNGESVGFVAIDASAQGIDQIMWILRPSKLTAIAKSH